MELLAEITRFLSWTISINVALNVLGFFSFRFPRVGRADQPLDLGVDFFDGKRIFGDSTTWGGLALVLIIGLTGEAVTSQQSLLLMALLVFLGHALGSFIKRRLGLSRGAFLPFVDHADYILVAGVVLFILDEIGFSTLVFSYITVVALTPLVTLFAHRFGLRQRRL